MRGSQSASAGAQHIRGGLLLLWMPWYGRFSELFLHMGWVIGGRGVMGECSLKIPAGTVQICARIAGRGMSLYSKYINNRNQAIGGRLSKCVVHGEGTRTRRLMAMVLA